MALQSFSSYPKKSLGQNYLIDENISKNIVNSFDIKNDDFVLEIGSGKGAITKYLLEKTKNVIAVEIDDKNSDYLKEKFKNLNLFREDFLKLDLKKLSNKLNYNKSIKELRVIGNIPYNVTSEILFKLVDNRDLIVDAQIMMQEEVARRIVARPGTKAYGILSVMLQIFCLPKLLFKVSKNCFYPKPKVDSRIVHFDFRTNRLKEISDLDFFRKFIRTSFGMRRKTLRNTLKSLNINTNEVNFQFDFSKRAESLSVNELISLSNNLNKHLSEGN